MKQTKKGQLHPRNPHAGPYDFPALTKACPELVPLVGVSQDGWSTIDFADPLAVKLLNRALLQSVYGLVWWDIPPQALCPPVPGRADHIHYVADLLAGDRNGQLPTGPQIRVLDIGVGASCIYPIIGNRSFGWSFVASDINPNSLVAAQKIIDANPLLRGMVELRRQVSAVDIFRNVIVPGERFALTICNPPFHDSPGSAQVSNQQRLSKMGLRPADGAKLNFGGQGAELWCSGGELGFIKTMIRQSFEYRETCAWFSTLVSKRDNLPEIQRELKKLRPVEMHCLVMAQGQKTSRIVAWTFQDKVERSLLKTQ